MPLPPCSRQARRWQARLPSVSACASTSALLLALFRTQHLCACCALLPSGGESFGSLDPRAELDRARLAWREGLLELPADVRPLRGLHVASNSVLASELEIRLVRA